MTTTPSMANNLRRAESSVPKKALFLPEESDYIASFGLKAVALVKSAEDSEFVRGLREEACLAKLPIHVGVYEPRNDAGKVKNTLLWIDHQGKITQRYQKIHLFDVEIRDGPVLKESACVERGMKILPPFEAPVGKVASTICFDLRFPEISIALKRQGCDIITFPSAFTVPTGKAHWQPLLRARAIETQSYVIAAAQVRVS
ncbi:carbon-nitrogen hydrolase [Immersiella caudata]|uniref:Carbon-nitrogen hydrolase n=1 Tax=Immersiella caudata TaxID=314043 RepID=A0AA39XHB0_9PEZI|nr:carbon-nitrogen hydrolase [Immersiella caudata]